VTTKIFPLPIHQIGFQLGYIRFYGTQTPQ